MLQSDSLSKDYETRLVDSVYEVLHKHMQSKYPTNLLYYQNRADLKALSWDLVKSFHRVEFEEAIKFNSVPLEKNKPK